MLFSPNSVGAGVVVGTNGVVGARVVRAARLMLIVAGGGWVRTHQKGPELGPFVSGASVLGGALVAMVMMGNISKLSGR